MKQKKKKQYCDHLRTFINALRSNKKRKLLQMSSDSDQDSSEESEN